MHNHGFRSLLIPASMFAGMIAGCLPYTRYEQSAKNAWMMYTEQNDDLGPPSLHREQFIYDIGRDEFVADLVLFVHTKYGPEALYGLGWFGDRRHAAVAAEALDDEDPEVRRVALMAFSRLTHTQCSEADQAKRWWSEHKEEFPRLAPRGKGKKSGGK